MNPNRLIPSLPDAAKRVLLACLLVFSAYLSVQLFNFSASNGDEDSDHQRYFNNSYKIFSLNLPEDLSFANELVPLEKLDVREKLDRELLVNTYWQSSSILHHKRANRWFPVIEKILAEEQVPDDLKYLALIESGLTNVVSPAGATGFWQFLKETGKEYGLEIRPGVDERYHVELATRAACLYLKEAKQKYGSWTLAAASYNMGMNGLDKQLKRQKSDNYFDLLLNEETGRYVYRAIALKEILTNSSQYGFHLREKDLYLPYAFYEIEVDSSVSDLAVLAFAYNTDYKTLKLLNPWLRDNSLQNPNHKTYLLKIPDTDFNSPLGDQ